MPPNTSRIVDRVLARIAVSEYKLTVHYPALRKGPKGVGPIVQPISILVPFAGPPTMAPVVDEPDTLQPSVTLKCLYLDAAGLSQLRKQTVEVQEGPWSREMNALARVSAEDVEVAVGRTVFEGASYVTVNEERFGVLGLSKLGASGSTKGTYYVYLKGAAKST